MRRIVLCLAIVLTLSVLWGKDGSCDLLLQFNMKGGTILRGIVPVRFHYEITGYPTASQRDSLFATGGLRSGERYYDITGDVAPLDRNGIRVSYRQLTMPDGALPEPGVVVMVKQVHLLAHAPSVFLVAAQEDLLRLPRSRIDKIVFLGPATDTPPVTATIVMVPATEMTNLFQGSSRLLTIGTLHPQYVFCNDSAISDTLLINLFGMNPAETPEWFAPLSDRLYKEPDNPLYTLTANQVLALLPHADALETAFLQYYYDDPNAVPVSRRDHPMPLSVRPGAQEPPLLDPDRSNTLIAFAEQRIGPEKLPIVPGISAAQFQKTLTELQQAVRAQYRGCHFERVPADSLFAPVKMELHQQVQRIDAMVTLVQKHPDGLGTPLTADEFREFAALGYTPASTDATLRAAVTSFLLDAHPTDSFIPLPPLADRRLLQRHHILALSAPSE